MAVKFNPPQATSRTGSMRAPTAAHAFTGKKITAPAPLVTQYRYLAIRGSAPIGGPQGSLHLTPTLHRGLSTQVLYPAPVIPQKQYATGHAVARTVSVGSVALQNKPFGAPAFRGTGAKPYGGPPPTPLMLGSGRQVGRDTIRKPVFQPPQTLIPAVMRKLFTRG